MTALATTTPTIEGLEQVLLSGDLGSLNPYQRVSYYQRVCESVGLNPLTQPFEYLRLQGKTILYARRAATEQLRKMHSVSITILSKETVEGCYVVTARATLPSGRTDEDVGSVPVDGLKGEALSNAWMKATTKAKRRVTLAICGLSFLDESELEGVRGAERVEMPQPAPAPQPLAPVVALPVPAPAAVEAEPDADLTPSEQQTVKDVFARTLYRCKTRDELVTWLVGLVNLDQSREVKRHLWVLFTRHCLTVQPTQDPNVLLRRAQDVIEQAKKEADHG